jgi:hypothetical protein
MDLTVFGSQSEPETKPCSSDCCEIGQHVPLANCCSVLQTIARSFILARQFRFRNKIPTARSSILTRSSCDFGLDPHAVKPSYSGNPASAQSCSQKFRGLFSLITVLEPRIVESPFFDASHENGAKIRCGWGWFLPRPSSPARRTSRSRQTVGRGKDRWDSARFHPRTPTQAGSLCYIALRSVERFVEMLPEGSSARPPLPRDGVS